MACSAHVAREHHTEGGVHLSQSCHASWTWYAFTAERLLLTVYFRRLVGCTCMLHDMHAFAFDPTVPD